MEKIMVILTCLILNVTMAQEKTTTIYLIRHAEKADASADPMLSDAGVDRANKWGKYFEDKNITTYYTTAYNRTKMTAAAISSTISKLQVPGSTKTITMKGYDPAFSVKRYCQGK